MKFGKLFMHQIQEIMVPEWRNKFLSYKKLKKLIRKMPECGTAEEEFLSLLNNDIDTLNAFFIEQEEEFIIRYQELQQNLKRANDLWEPETDYKGTDIVIKNIVDLHGEMILLLNLYIINQTGFAKLVKKYEKRTSRLQRHPVLEQQFLTCDLIPKLVSECESIIYEAYHVDEKSELANEATALDGEGIFKNAHNEPLLTTQHDAEVVVKEGDQVSEPNIKKSLSALGKYRDNFSLQSLVPFCLNNFSTNQMTYCSCWRCFLYDSANELLFCLFPSCVGQRKFEI